MALVHHELCFGCGLTNLFGLSLQLQELTPGSVAGRCFIKQDHQGAERGSAHEGVLAAALSEAMALACGPSARPRSLQIELLAPAPVGVFLELEAHRDESAEGAARARANANSDGLLVARGRGSYSY